MTSYSNDLGRRSNLLLFSTLNEWQLKNIPVQMEIASAHNSDPFEKSAAPRKDNSTVVVRNQKHFNF